MIHVEKKQGRIHLILDAYFMGTDIVVMISGDDQPHLEPLQQGTDLNHCKRFSFRTIRNFILQKRLPFCLENDFQETLPFAAERT